MWHSDDVLANTHCDINWMAGSISTAEPHFTEAAPALLGFDDDIYAYCQKAAGALHPAAWAHATDEEIALACIEANRNVLRLRARKDPWNMCQNLRWMLCAVQGKLPGQQGRTALHLATAPKKLRVESLHGWDFAHIDPSYYTVEDVFYLEVCLLNEFCANRTALFKAAEAGAAVECDLDPDRLQELQKLLVALPAPSAGPAVRGRRQ